jgi:hypothetical protein
MRPWLGVASAKERQQRLSALKAEYEARRREVEGAEEAVRKERVALDERQAVVLSREEDVGRKEEQLARLSRELRVRRGRGEGGCGGDDW